MKLNVGFIGSGNVAWHLSHAIDSAGHTVSQVISRNEDHAKELAVKFGALYSTRLSSVDASMDVCIICVSDNQIQTVVEQLVPSRVLMVHTCGSQRMDVLTPCSPNIGVFYPLQSFSKGRSTDMMKVPFLLEASSSSNYQILEKLADSISNSVQPADSETRLKYHLAAVFVNNFTNYLFQESASFLEENQLDFDVLKPIILETALKVQHLSPKDAQTGPAKRGDVVTIAKHRELMQQSPALLELYNELTKRLSKKP